MHSLAVALLAVSVIKIDPSGPGRVFEGIGAVSAGASSRLLVDYPEPYRSQVLDYLFKPNYGAALQHLKVEIGGDTNSTDGSEPSHMHRRDDLNFTRGYEWWLMKEARKRNPKIILDCLAWGAPGWIGDGKYYSQDMADYVVKFIQGAKKVHGLDIEYTGVWNEIAYDTDWIKLLRRTLDANGLKTRIVAPDEYAKQWDIIKDMAKDPALDAAIYAVGVHYPRLKGKMTPATPDWAKSSGKRMWSSEDQPPLVGGVIAKRDWIPGGKTLAQVYNTNYLDGQMTKTEIWSPISSYYDSLPHPNSGLMYANTPWSGHYEVQPTIWVTAHTTQFVQPGWRYLDGACGHLDGGGSYVSFVSPSSRDYSVVVETVGATSDQTLTLQLAGRLRRNAVHVWRSDGKVMFQQEAGITPRDGSFTVTLHPDALYTLTSTTGQRKGSASPPAASEWRLPYKEDFERTSLGASPKYFADQDGAFEVVSCSGRNGRCLRQVVDRHPISWFFDPNPYTLLGSSDWSDYEVSVDVLLEQAGPVAVFGRIDSANCIKERKAPWPSAYVLSLGEDGAWTLSSTKIGSPAAQLAAGKLAFPGNTWHRMALAFQGSRIRASIDSGIVAEADDDAHKSGMVGFGTGWHTAQFDNLVVR